jgi:hypothetical protein
LDVPPIATASRRTKAFIMRASSGFCKPMIAEKVTKVTTPLVLCDKEGTPFTVRYDAVLKARKNENCVI